MNSPFKFLRRVRIHGRECGAVARALHHEAQKVALIQAEQSLISDEKAFSRQADLKKSFRSTFIERKQMSTKTTLKRVALVAVSALGFGLLSAIPSVAATVYTSAISVTTNKAPVAGANGTVVTHTIRFSTSTSTAQTVEPNVILTSKPSGSSLAYQVEGGTTTVAVGKFEIGNAAADTTDATEGQSANLTSASESGYTNYQAITYMHAYYDVAGTYTYTIFDDEGVDDNIFNGNDFGYVYTVVVGATGASASYKATVTATNSTSIVAGANGSLVKISLTDAAGNAASPDNAGGVKVTVSGTGDVTAVNNSAVTATTTYVLGYGDFNGAGNAWVNITNAAAETITLTLSGSGSMTSSFTAPSAITLTFTTGSASSTVPTITIGSTLVGSGVLVGSAATNAADGTATANKASTSALTFKTGASAATPTAKDRVIVTDTSGAISGLAGTAYDLIVTEGDSDTCTYCGTFTVTPTWNSGVTGQSFEVANLNGFGLTVTSATAAATTATVTSADVIRSAPAGTHSFTVNVDNQFGANMSNVNVTASIAGRNSTVSVASSVSNSSGNATLTYTDVSTSTTSLVDTLTFTAASGVTDTASVTYTSAAGLGVSTVVATTSQTSATTGADNYSITPFDIAEGDGVETGYQTVTITVKDANGVALAGVPVTVSVAGAGVAIMSTKKTVYTSALGVATSQVYAWLAPTYGTKYVVTVTAGATSDDVNTYWAQTTAESVRTFTATVAKRIITVTASDRFGNPVYNAAFTAKITKGDGFFGTGTNIASGNTGTDGVLKFNTLESETDLTIEVQAGGSSSYGQTDAPATYIDSAEADNTFTAATAGTATTAETGVGDTYAPAGINKVNVAVTGAPSASQVAAEAANDAAAEATDAANAATDAANLAAEAADAATVAAEEARDAADAATAAVEELATQVATLMAALKAQITTLANTVAKIAKKVKA